LFIASKRRAFANAEALNIGAMASRGDPKDLKKQVREWTRD